VAQRKDSLLPEHPRPPRLVGGLAARHPALVIELRSPLGEVDGTVISGSSPSFDGELRNASLALLPFQGIAAGTQLDGRVDARLDVTIAEAGPQGRVHFEAKQGSLTLPLLPIGVPFDNSAATSPSAATASRCSTRSTSLDRSSR